MLGQARHLLELDSTNFQGRAELARAYLLLGRCAESLATLKQAPEPAAALFRGFLGYAYARCGHRTQALAQLKQFGSEVRAGRYVSHIAFARIFAGLGDTERALAELDSAYAERAWTVFALRMDPLFDGLRADPRFARLVKKVGRTS
jgi:tetratricopeptide (TPR) repeat protein